MSGQASCRGGWRQAVPGTIRPTRRTRGSTIRRHPGSRGKADDRPFGWRRSGRNVHKCLPVRTGWVPATCPTVGTAEGLGCGSWLGAFGTLGAGAGGAVSGGGPARVGTGSGGVPASRSLCRVEIGSGADPSFEKQLAERDGLVVHRVACGIEERDRTAGSGRPQHCQCVGFSGQFQPVTSPELGPARWVMAEPAAQRVTGRQFPEPPVQPETLFADPPRPQAIHQEPCPVRRGRVVRTRV
ncbi:MAG: hypothetical protein KatS3mg132_874 [Limisphaera sp.]|nr:MAG: hypothetical protein KatS3mg132_874 [Limisphaera sp.]